MFVLSGVLQVLLAIVAHLALRRFGRDLAPPPRDRTPAEEHG
jgi:hypothetical protein